MAYRADIYYGINNIEHYIRFAGKYGAKGEKRAKKKKATPEQVKRQNQINRENRLRRTIQANFYPNDVWVCLKYKKGTRLTIEQLKNDLCKKFIPALRKEYKKRCEQLKFIYRIEIGKHGGSHVHILINRIWGVDMLVQKCWGHCCNFTNIREEGGYRKLAAYIVKPLPEDGQMSFMSAEDLSGYSKYTYNSSRNLVRPEPERKEYNRRTVKKLITEGIKAAQGYNIDKNSIRVGVNEYTGYSYIYYTETRVKLKERELKLPEELNTWKT